MGQTLGGLNDVQAAPGFSNMVGVGPDASDQPVLRAKIDTAAANTTLVAAGTAIQKVRVLEFAFIVKTTAVDIKFQSDNSSAVDLTGAMTPAAGTPLVAPWNPHGHFETAAGKLLNLNQSGTSQISGWLTYQLVSASD